jgi:hypothetical protein
VDRKQNVKDGLIFINRVLFMLAVLVACELLFVRAAQYWLSLQPIQDNAPNNLLQDYDEHPPDNQ